jgi:hypothetical protein
MVRGATRRDHAQMANGVPMRLISALLRGRRRFEAIAAVAVVSSLGWASAAQAVPPTVAPSPGYDARLAEKHATMSASEHPHELHQLRPRRAPKIKRDPR